LGATLILLLRSRSGIKEDRLLTARHISRIGFLGFSIAGLLSGLAPRMVSAEPVTKEMCIDAHSRGQDAREQGKLSLARKLFLTCAQPACPALVQGDCARFADDLAHQQSSLTFVARDAQGADLVDTAVYIDDLLVVSRLDDGKPHDVDPGRHTVRFSSRGKDQTVALVVGTGEQGRAVVVTFPTINAPPPGSVSATGVVTPEPEIRIIHPTGSKVVFWSGVGVAAVGAGVAVWGFTSVPSNCSISSTRCAASPGDPAFQKASDGVSRMNIGIVTGAIGLVAAAVGGYWYYAKGHTETDDAKVVMPMVLGDGAGLAWLGSF
jgi:hypothetical protein